MGAKGARRKKVTGNRQVVPIEELRPFADALHAVDDSPDLNFVITATALLENAFGALIQKVCVDGTDVPDIVHRLLNDGTGALTTFAARADLCRCLGLISAAAHQRAKKIGNIRNVFAHRVEPVKFDHPDVVEQCKKIEPVTLAAYERDESGGVGSGQYWEWSVGPTTHPLRDLFSLAVRDTFAEVNLAYHQFKQSQYQPPVFRLLAKGRDTTETDASVLLLPGSG